MKDAGSYEPVVSLSYRELSFLQRAYVNFKFTVKVNFCTSLSNEEFELAYMIYRSYIYTTNHLFAIKTKHQELCVILGCQGSPQKFAYDF